MTNYRNYVYPDHNDKVTTKMIDEKESLKGSGYWKRSEQNIINKMKDQIEKNTKKEALSFLDAGCGNGRLLPEFEKYFKNILLIDPDKNRIQSAKELVDKLNLSDKVTCKTLSIESINLSQKFDVILCNHVLQHVHTKKIRSILEKLYEILNENGLLLLTTCNSKKNKGYFVKQYVKNSKLTEEIINEDEFNILTDKKEELPIHFFDKGNLINLLKDLNYKLNFFEKFHDGRDIFFSLTK